MSDDAEYKERLLKLELGSLPSLAGLRAAVQHEGQIGFQEERTFPEGGWPDAVKWCIAKSREPGVRFAALSCGGVSQRSWWDGELRYDVRRYRCTDVCVHHNRHGEEEQ